jgi:hypothetical protein
VNWWRLLGLVILALSGAAALLVAWVLVTRTW